MLTEMLPLSGLYVQDIVHLRQSIHSSFIHLSIRDKTAVSSHKSGPRVHSSGGWASSEATDTGLSLHPGAPK